MNRSEIERIDKITAAVHYLLKGKDPNPILYDGDPDDEIRQLSGKVNELMSCLREVREFAIPLSCGNLDGSLPKENFIGSPFKQLQASLRHLTWQTRQIAHGDFNQRVQFMGEFSDAFNTMVEALEEAHDQLMDEIARAEQQADLKSRYLNVMAHDIRTPIGAIIGFAEMLLEEQLPEQHVEKVEIIKRNSESLIALINNILDLAKLEKGRMEIESIPYSLKSLGEDLGALIASRLNEGVHYLFDLDEALPETVMGDPHRLRQVLMNLVGNAAKFTESGSITLRIERARAAGSGFALRFFVVDTGVGIPGEKLDRIFTPFTQADSGVASKFGGTGLGVNIALELVELMGGKLEVESVPGRGTTFFFTIPAREAGEHEIGVENEGGNEIEGTFDESRLKGLRVMVIDDNPINRHLLNRLLKGLGVHVEEKESGEDGIPALATGSFDVVFVDQVMPGMDGIKTTGAIRQLPECASLPILAFTADDSAETRDRLLGAGMDGIVYKPIRKDAIIHELGMVLAGSNEVCRT